VICECVRALAFRMAHWDVLLVSVVFVMVVGGMSVLGPSHLEWPTGVTHHAAILYASLIPLHL
jgi:hypothetical protein